MTLVEPECGGDNAYDGWRDGTYVAEGLVVRADREAVDESVVAGRRDDVGSGSVDVG